MQAINRLEEQMQKLMKINESLSKFFIQLYFNKFRPGFEIEYNAISQFSQRKAKFRIRKNKKF